MSGQYVTSWECRHGVKSGGYCVKCGGFRADRDKAHPEWVDGGFVLNKRTVFVLIVALLVFVQPVTSVARTVVDWWAAPDLQIPDLQISVPEMLLAAFVLGGLGLASLARGALRFYGILAAGLGAAGCLLLLGR